MAYDSFFDRVTTECGDTARAIMEMADRFREYGDTAMAGLADAAAQKMSKLAFDSMKQTQPITVPALPTRGPKDD